MEIGGPPSPSEVAAICDCELQFDDCELQFDMLQFDMIASCSLFVVVYFHDCELQFDMLFEYGSII